MAILTPKQDAYGEALRDAFAGLEPVEVIERDDGFVDAGFGMGEYGVLPGHHRQAMREMALKRGARVLDVGAGLCRHAVAMQKSGRRVTVMDHSPGAVRVAKGMGMRDVRHMDVMQLTSPAGRRELGGPFEAVLLMGNNLGLLGTEARAKRLLNAFAEITTEAGVILAETTNPHPAPDEATRAYLAANRRAGRLPGQFRIRNRYRELVSPWFWYLYLSPGELKGLVKGTAWQIEKLYPSPTDRTYVVRLGKKNPPPKR